jgi:XTP/dITP diphosphohydrolase
MRIVMASSNPHKVAEIVELMTAVAPMVTVVGRPSTVADVVEDADTLVGNARLKARSLVDATGLAALSDDTGLFVDALGGLPGVHTARYAGARATAEANNEKLLEALSEESLPEGRRATFRTVAMVMFPDGSELVAQGEVLGHISRIICGSHGFGYDPVFVPDGFIETFSEMSLSEKQEISHRGRAFRNLGSLLKSLLESPTGQHQPTQPAS